MARKLILALLFAVSLASAQTPPSYWPGPGSRLKLFNFPLSALPPASSSGNLYFADVNNNPTVSVNGKLNGFYYPLGAWALRVRRGLYYQGGGTASFASVGDALATSCSTNSAISVTSSNGAMLACLTSSSASNVAYVGGGNQTLIIPGTNIWWSGYGAPGTTTTTSWQFGLSNTYTNTITCSTFHCAEFIYSNSSSVSSTNYVCTINNGGTGTQNQTDTGVAVVAGTPHQFDIREDTANGFWYYYIDGVPKCIFSTAFPTAILHQVMVVEQNAGSVAAQLDIGFTELWADH
jgi:hypothetical protein